MAASNKTTPYELPLYESDDTTTWLADFNNAMLKINTGMVQNSTKAESVVTIADTAVKTAQDAANKVAGYDATIAKQTEDIKLNADNIQHNMQDITDTMTAVNGNTESIKHLTDDVTAVTTTVNQHTADIEELGNEINIVSKSPTLVWTNPNPTDTFNAQDVVPNLPESKNQWPNYTYLIIEYTVQSTNSSMHIDTISILLTGRLGNSLVSSSNAAAGYALRNFAMDYLNGIGNTPAIIKFSNGYLNGSVANNCMIPSRIYVK